jgi:hypothetical protein
VSVTSFSEILFASYLVYSPKGASEASQKSRIIRDHVKGATPRFLEQATARLVKDVGAGELGDFFDDATIFVPAPRSAPLVKGGLWPGDRIAQALVDAGLGSEVRILLERVKSVPKAAFARPGERPTYAIHRASLSVRGDLFLPHRMVVVDDVITKGTMLGACCALLQEAYPEADVRAFALLRTMGFIPEVERLIVPCLGRLILRGDTVWRSD